MRIAIAADSPAVVRSLTAIVRASGHTVVDVATQAELILTTTQAEATSPTQAVLRLHPPISPHLLIQKLMHWQQAQPLALANGWQLDVLARQMEHATGATVPLTEKESQLLRQLASVAPQPLSREALLESVWGIEREIDTHTLETHIYRLRSKLAALSPSAGDITTEQASYAFVMG